MFRPKPKFLPFLQKEDPPIEIKNKLIDCYENGGLEAYENKYISKFGNFRIKQYATLTETSEFIEWKYVGDLWWCRRREFSPVENKPRKRVRDPHYEFGRLKAMRNDNNSCEIVDIWNNEVHGHIEEPIIVYRSKDNAEGVIVSYNNYELFVQWVDKSGRHSTPVPIKDLKSIRFKYVDDEHKMRFIMKTIEQNIKKVSCANA